MNNPHLGIMFKFKSKTEADKYIGDREREAAKVTKAPLESTETPVVCDRDYSEEQVARMFAKGGE